MIQFNKFVMILDMLKEFYKNDDELSILASVEYFRYLKEPIESSSKYRSELVVINENNYRWNGIPIIVDCNAKSLIAIRFKFNKESYFLIVNCYEDFLIELTRLFYRIATKLERKLDLLEVNTKALCNLRWE